MNMNFGWCALAMLGLAGCGGNTHGEAVVNNDPVAMRTAPAGTATLAFLDLVGSVRMDGLPARVVLPPSETAFGWVANAALPAAIQVGVTGNVATYTFTNAKAASGGALNGTITDTLSMPAPGKVIHTEVFDLVATLDSTRSTHYTGTQTVTLSGTTATLTSVPATAVQVAYLDSTNPSLNKTYVFTPALSGDWSVPGKFVLDGSYSFARTGGDTITASIPAAAPITWTSSCSYPVSGTLGLSLVDPAYGTASTTAQFGPTCGRMTLSGGVLSLGGL